MLPNISKLKGGRKVQDNEDFVGLLPTRKEHLKFESFIEVCVLPDKEQFELVHGFLLWC